MHWSFFYRKNRW